MYKNQLQELAQRSCFNLPSYICIREGPDHAPRFKAVVTFNGESFESPHFFSTLRQAEHAAAEVALSSLSSRGPSHSLAARILDETGVYKNLLQEISQRVGAPLPYYTTYRSGLGHQPVFTGTVELYGIIFTGEPAKNKKQAEKNAALAAWTALKQLAAQSSSSSSEVEFSDEMEQVTIARALLTYKLKEKMKGHPSKGPFIFPQKFPAQSPRSSSPQRPPVATSKILPLICQKHHPKTRSVPTSSSDNVHHSSSHPRLRESPGAPTSGGGRHRFPTSPAPPYIPFQQLRASSCRGMAQPVTIRNAVPCFSAPPGPPSKTGVPPGMRASPVRAVPPVCIRSVVPVHAAPPARNEDQLMASKDPKSEKTATDGTEQTKLDQTTNNVGTNVKKNDSDSKTVSSNGKEDKATGKTSVRATPTLEAIEDELKQLLKCDDSAQKGL